MSYETEILEVAEEYVEGNAGYDSCIRRCLYIAQAHDRDAAWSSVDFEDAVTSLRSSDK